MNKTKLAFVIVGTTVGARFLFDFFGADPKTAKETSSQELFNARCSQCHGIGEANNFDSYLPSSIQNTVQRMQEKADSGISSKEAQQIYEYLVYTNATSHKDQLDEELKALPDNQRKEEQAKLDAILRGPSKLPLSEIPLESKN